MEEQTQTAGAPPQDLQPPTSDAQSPSTDAQADIGPIEDVSGKVALIGALSLIAFTDQLTVAAVAAIAHTALLPLQALAGDEPGLPWGLLSEEAQQIVIDSAGAQLQDPGRTPEATHNNWIAEKIRHGWKFGPERDEEAKTHPFMIPFGQLPRAQQYKARVYSAIVATLAPYVKL